MEIKIVFQISFPTGSYRDKNFSECSTVFSHIFRNFHKIRLNFANIFICLKMC